MHTTLYRDLAALIAAGYTCLTRRWWGPGDYVKISGDQVKYCLVDGLVEHIQIDQLVDTGWLPKEE